MKKGYWMGMVDVTDEANYPKYIAANKAAFDKYGAKFLVRGGQGQVFEGPAATGSLSSSSTATRPRSTASFAGIPGGAEARRTIFESAFRHRRGSLRR